MAGRGVQKEGQGIVAVRTSSSRSSSSEGKSVLSATATDTTTGLCCTYSYFY